MQTDSELRLITLGRLALLGPAGDADPSLSKRRRKLALLAVLALAQRPLSRDMLTEMFWGGQPDDRARHSLSNTLSHLRKVLGRDAITAHGSDVELSAEHRLSVDVLELMEAAAARDDSRVLELYGGPFLAGVYVDGSPTFEQWVAAERERHEAVFLKAASRECMKLARARRWDECAELARRWLDAAPVSAEAALYRFNALKAPDTREAHQRALEEYERLRERLLRDYQLRPDRAVAALARELLDRVMAEGVAPGMTSEFSVVRASGSIGQRSSGGGMIVAPTPVTTAPLTPATRQAPESGAPSSGERGSAPSESAAIAETVRLAPSAARRRWPVASRSLVAAAVVLVAVAATAAAFLARGVWRARESARAQAVPVVAIVGIDFIGRDTGDTWLADGLPQMLATKLSRTNDVELIAPDRVRQLRERAQIAPRAQISGERARDLARRLGATWAVTGTVADADTVLQLDFTVRDVASGSTVRTVSLRARNVLALADAAAMRLLDVAGSARPGPQLADVETPNVEAYQHYIRYLQALSENGDVAVRELDAALLLDSGFVSALRARMNVAHERGERAVLARLDAAFQRAAYRASDWDRLSIAASDAQRSGNWARAEAAARALVERFPRDPRAYQWLTNVYSSQGRWSDAERAALAQLALDSLATTAGRGPCIPCQAYQDLASVQIGGLGDFPAAERTLRRLLDLQPEVSGAWGTLAFVLAAQQRFDESITSMQRAIALAGDAPANRTELARLMLMARRLESADSIVQAMAADTARVARAGAAEIRYLLERERGQFAASVATLQRLLREFPDRAWLRLALAEGRARVPDYRGAAREFEGLSHTPVDTARGFRAPDLVHGEGDAARAFAWHHALEADAINASVDTVVLRALADSIERVGARSYYGRDHWLHHHVLGLIAARAGRWAEAEQHFRQAQWGAWGWTRSVVEEAKAQLAQSGSREAVATLRRAYVVPLDGMGRYVPRSEVDFWMAMAFGAAAQSDSARLYAEHVRRAWANADPAVKSRLRELRPAD